MVKKYIPEQGDIVSLNFNPQSGKEQAGRRPALVLSPSLYNGRLGLAICCPITSQIKGYPLEVLIPQSLKTQGVVLSDHVKNIDWQERRAYFIEKMPTGTLLEVLAKLDRLLHPTS